MFPKSLELECGASVTQIKVRCYSKNNL